MYHNGRGVLMDDAEAVRWFLKATDQGDANAQLQLGNIYLKGQGVPKDYVEAARWSLKAAAQADAIAQTLLDSSTPKVMALHRTMRTLLAGF
jgi:TPR repeat protein